MTAPDSAEVEQMCARLNDLPFDCDHVDYEDNNKTVADAISLLRRLSDDGRDAQRYRWIRADNTNADDFIQDYNGHTLCGPDLDESIDSAIQRGIRGRGDEHVYW
jgi:hypothetical protein